MPDHDVDRIYEIARGFQGSRILLTAIALNLFGALGDTARTSTEVAEDLGADARATDRLMDALAAMRLLTKEDGRFRNAPAAAAHLVPDRPGDISGGLMHMNHLWDTWSTLTEAVRAGRSVVQRQPADSQWTVAFIAAMQANAARRAGSVVDRIDLAGVRRLLDVGGGSGAYAIAFCRAKPDLEATIFDLPSVIPLTQEYIAEAGLLDRIHLMPGDYNHDDLGHGYDLAFLSAVIHSNSPRANRALLERCHRALNPGGRIVIQDFLMDDDRVAPENGALFALNMLVGTAEGDTFTASEVTDWLLAAGFEGPHRIDPTGTGTALLIAARP